MVLLAALAPDDRLYALRPPPPRWNVALAAADPASSTPATMPFETPSSRLADQRLRTPPIGPLIDIEELTIGTGHERKPDASRA